MKGLLIKDFKLLKGQKNFFMTITAISIIMIIVSPGTSFPIGFLGFVGALFSLSSISYDAVSYTHLTLPTNSRV